MEVRRISRPERETFTAVMLGRSLADEFEALEARARIDWAIGKPEGFGGR